MLCEILYCFWCLYFSFSFLYLHDVTCRGSRIRFKCPNILPVDCNHTDVNDCITNYALYSGRKSEEVVRWR